MQSAMKVKTLTAFVSCVNFLTKLFKKTKENGIGCGKFARMAFEFVVASSIFGVTFIWPYHCVKSVQIRSYLWSVFSFIRTEYRKIRTRNNSVFGHFPGSVDLLFWASEFWRSYRYTSIKILLDPSLRCFSVDIAKFLRTAFFIG